ncbi:MAG TPA: ATP-dependent DNA helicase RecG [Solirubrobacteraceae bacterium]|nr:ATP-dependent DNA helicase RecG [Solirubrobacteraceae bacterium]
MPRAFASSRALAAEELSDTPLRWPRPSRLEVELELPGKRMAAGMQALGVSTVGDLLEHLPSDSREARTLATLRAGEQATVAVEVRSIVARPVRRRGMRPLVEARVADATGTMRATFFNQPWLVDRYPPGTRLLLHGKTDARGGFSVAHHALGGEAAAPQPGAGEGQAVAHYPAADGVTSTQILTLVQGVRDALEDVVEALPASIRVGERLPGRASALAAMHFPRHPEDPEGGRRRLAFEELLLSQLVFLRRRAGRRARTGAAVLGERDALGGRWLEHGLPFELTGDQRRAIEQIAGDLERGAPMQRLLMGDVGSGKTVVALYAMLQAVGHGCQAALMAPTETLAEQHFATIQGLLGGELVTAELLTGSTPAARRRGILGKLSSGELSLIVGTHALIEPDVAFDALAVAVIDEQHRFGVRQRAALEGSLAEPALAEASSAEPPAAGRTLDRAARSGRTVPHTLHMTATPIPRTLALARYGDLDTSTLRELPRGRQPIDTQLVCGDEERAQAYAQLRAELAAGRQAYVVCPLVEEVEDGESSELGVRAAKAELVRLREGELAGHELELLHGGMKAREKQRAMAAFASGQAQVLVATTVIEVGIDVPNATAMLVENAERFGLSQLHQLRGRVGRGEHRSRCLLVASSGEAGSGRLAALVRHADGFRLAEIDLAMRKEGELAGTRQSGLGYFHIARLPEDAQLLERARSCAEAILAADPELCSPEHVLLGLAVERLHGGQAPTPIPA